MSDDIDITSGRGLFDPDSGEPTATEPDEQALRDFLASNGVAGTAIETAAREAMVQAAQSVTEGVFSWWPAVRRFFAPEIHTIVDTCMEPVEISGYWLTLPAVPDAKVTLSVAVTKTRQVAATLKVAGVGGGPTFQMAVRSGLQHEALSQQRAVLTAMGRFQRVQVSEDGKVLGEYARLVYLDKDNVEWSYPAAQVPAAAQLGPQVSSVGYDLTTNTSADEVTDSVARDTTWDFSAGLSLPQFGGLTVGISGQVSYQQEANYEYQLPPGRYYRATRYASFPVFVWTLR